MLGHIPGGLAAIAVIVAVSGASTSGPVAAVASPHQIAPAPTPSSPRPGDDLERLTVPAAVLPSNCQLRPTPANGMFRTNPAVVTDPMVLGFMQMMVIGRTPAARPADLDADAAARAADIEVGYAAFYREQGGSPEIGVYALRLKNPPSPGLPLGLPPNQVRQVKGSVAMFYWSDARANAPDLGCFDVVRRHIEAVEFR